MDESGRVALLASPASHFGGVEHVVKRLAKCLHWRGVSVDVVLVDATRPRLDLPPDGPRVVDLKSKRTATGLPALLRYLRRARPHVVVANSAVASIAVLLAQQVLGRSFEVVVRFDNTFSMRRAAAGLKGRATLDLALRMWRRAGAVVVVSRGAEDDLLCHAPELVDLVHVVLPALDIDHHQKALEEVRHPWLRESDVPVILFVGRLAPQKACSVLLHAFAEAAKSRALRLVVVGDGPERDGLGVLARDLGIAAVVDFVGFQTNPAAFMANANVLAVSSVYEGCPVVVLEAMACGTQVVSTDCPSGPRELLADGKLGRLVPVGDALALAAALLDTLDQPVAPSLLRAGARPHSADIAADGYLNLFRRLCPSAPWPP